MNSSEYIDLVIPVLNPPHGWAHSVFEKHQELEKATNQTVRIFISDDGSSSLTEHEKLRAFIPNVIVLNAKTNSGKGYALRAGISVATSNIIIFTDADFPYEISSMQGIVNCLGEGADVALGYRQQDYYASVPWFRKGLSEAFRFVLKSILKFPISDTQCGLKGMNQKGKQAFMSTKINRFLVDMEFIKLALKGNLNIQPVIVNLRPMVKFSAMGPTVLARELVNFIRVLFS